MQMSSDTHEIIIVGGGICGLATALALHREGIKSIVLEKSNTREIGAAISVLQNGWTALDHLGLSKLREKAIVLTPGSNTWLSNGMRKAVEVGTEGRCLKRTDLLRALADALPPGTLYDGRTVQSVQINSNSPYSTIQLSDGTNLKAKIVIGCDGVHSVVAKALGLGPMKRSPIVTTRGFGWYEKGHGLPTYLNIWTSENGTVGHVPITHNLVYWFLTRRTSSKDLAIWKDQELIKEATMEAVKGYPSYVVDLLKNSDVDSMSLKSIWYRPPLELLTSSNFRKGTVVVSGDAMHAMAPFMAQGGSLSLEDAVILAKTLAPKLRSSGGSFPADRKAIEKALDEFLEKRRMRVFWISWQTHLKGLTNVGSTSRLIKWLSVFLLVVVFKDQISHLRFDCRR